MLVRSQEPFVSHVPAWQATCRKTIRMGSQPQQGAQKRSTTAALSPSVNTAHEGAYDRQHRQRATATSRQSGAGQHHASMEPLSRRPMREGGSASRRALHSARMPSARLYKLSALASFAFSGAALRGCMRTPIMCTACYDCRHQCRQQGGLSACMPACFGPGRLAVLKMSVRRRGRGAAQRGKPAHLCIRAAAKLSKAVYRSGRPRSCCTYFAVSPRRIFTTPGR